MSDPERGAGGEDEPGRDDPGRRTDDTYGRGGGDRFQAHEYSHAYSSARTGDWRRALRAYVAGHDRGWEADVKYRRAEETTDRTERPAREEHPVREPAPDVDIRETEAGTAGDEEDVSYGVPVPETFTFHRGPGRWRERLPRPARDRGRIGPAG